MHPIDRLISLIAPQKCINCNQEGAVLCQECAEQLDRLPSICFDCGRASRNFRPCTDCISKYKPDHVWIYSQYLGLSKELVHGLKFDQKRQAAEQIAQYISDALPYFAVPPIVTFVPTSPNRTRERAFDQAKLIAQNLTKIRGWQYQRLLTRQNETRQLGATRGQRLMQLKGVFRPVNLLLIKNQHVLLVDDVCTTGATLEACTKVLKKAGAKQIDAAVFAHTPKHRPVKLPAGKVKSQKIEYPDM